MKEYQHNKKILLVTDVEFWRPGLGRISPRVSTLVSYLAKISELSVMYLGPENPMDTFWKRSIKEPFSLVFPENKDELTNEDYGKKINEYIKKENIEICIIEWIELSFLLDYIPDSVTTILDTHDLVSEREQSFKAYGMSENSLSWEDELQLLDKYDKLIMIKEADYSKTVKALGTVKPILAPHPVSFPQQKIRQEATRIGFIGTEYPPNIDAIKWFLSLIWPKVSGQNLRLHLYGKVCSFIRNQGNDRVIMHGYVPNLKAFYNQVDIVINPVRFGAGIKVKNLEALGHGLPLITTSHGAMGIERGKGKAFLVEDDPQAFANSLSELTGQYLRRKSLGESAYAFTQERFSTEACFNSIRSAIYAA